MDNLSEIVWSLSLEGGPDESAGSSSDGAGWVGIFRGAFSADDLPEATPEELAQATTCAGCILREDTAGFREVEFFDKAEELESAWTERAAEVEPERLADAEREPEELAQALAESFTNGNGSEVVDRIRALPTARAVVVGIRTAQALGKDAHRLISRLER